MHSSSTRFAKIDALRGIKLTAGVKNKGLKFEVIGKEAISWYIEHGRKDVRSFRIRMNIILKDFGQRIADEIKPSEIDDWLKAHDWALLDRGQAGPEPRQAYVWQIAISQVAFNNFRIGMCGFPIPQGTSSTAALLIQFAPFDLQFEAEKRPRKIFGHPERYQRLLWTLRGLRLYAKRRSGTD